jgi:hypothetical protein
MKFHNVLLACALGAGSLLGTAVPASANPYYGTGYHGYGYRNGYGYPYRSGYAYRYGNGYPYRYGYPYGVGVGVGYGYVGGGYGYAPYPAVYGRRAYLAHRPYWRPYRRAYWGRRFVR